MIFLITISYYIDTAYNVVIYAAIHHSERIINILSEIPFEYILLSNLRVFKANDKRKIPNY